MNDGRSTKLIALIRKVTGTMDFYRISRDDISANHVTCVAHK